MLSFLVYIMGSVLLHDLLWFTDGLVVWKELAFDVSGPAGSQLCDLGRISESLYAQVSSAV